MLSVGGLTLYPIDCRVALASSLILYPPPHRPRLAANLPRREDDGLTTFHGCTTDGLGSASPPMARQRRQGKGDPLHLAIYLLVQACQLTFRRWSRQFPGNSQRAGQPATPARR